MHVLRVQKNLSHRLLETMQAASDRKFAVGGSIQGTLLKEMSFWRIDCNKMKPLISTYVEGCHHQLCLQHNTQRYPKLWWLLLHLQSQGKSLFHLQSSLENRLKTWRQIQITVLLSLNKLTATLQYWNILQLYNVNSFSNVFCILSSSVIKTVWIKGLD